LAAHDPISPGLSQSPHRWGHLISITTVPLSLLNCSRFQIETISRPFTARLHFFNAIGAQGHAAIDVSIGIASLNKVCSVLY
jgi:hypothetical protein